MESDDSSASQTRSHEPTVRPDNLMLAAVSLPPDQRRYCTLFFSLPQIQIQLWVLLPRNFLTAPLYFGVIAGAWQRLSTSERRIICSSASVKWRNWTDICHYLEWAAVCKPQIALSRRTQLFAFMSLCLQQYMLWVAPWALLAVVFRGGSIKTGEADEK